MAAVWTRLLLLGLVVAVAHGLTCRRCPIAILGRCLRPSDDVQCNSTTSSCITATTVTDGVIALLEPDALTNLHAIVTIQKMQKDALEIHILEHKLKDGPVQQRDIGAAVARCRVRCRAGVTVGSLDDYYDATLRSLQIEL
ncbi:unnamed protein product [Boreogadus saida]